MYDHNESIDNIDLKLAAIEWREGAEGRREFMAAVMEDHAALAEAFYSAYQALMDAGFSDAQAIQLITARGWHLEDEG